MIINGILLAVTIWFATSIICRTVVLASGKDKVRIRPIGRWEMMIFAASLSTFLVRVLDLS